MRPLERRTAVLALPEHVHNSVVFALAPFCVPCAMHRITRCGLVVVPCCFGVLFSRGQESTSEDVNFFYAMTMWAIATGNSRLEGLGRLQTGMVARSIDSYFLLKDSNTNHPVDFVRNKVRHSRAS